MTARCFADTNIFVYAASHAAEDGAKKRAARDLLATEDIGLSAQVLQEFYAVATAKERLGISPAEARKAIEAMSEFPVAPITADLVKQAIGLASQHRLSYWDAAIVAAAQLSHRYITDRFLPDKAIDLIDESASKLRIEIDSLPEELDSVERKIRQLEIEREALLRELTIES